VRKKTHSEYVSEVFDAVGNEYTVLGTYDGSKVPTLMRHNSPNCNYKWKSKPNHFLNGNERCPICAIEKRNKKLTKTNKKFIQEVEDIYGNEYTILSPYLKSKTPIMIRHNSMRCNNKEFLVTPNNFLRGHTCAVCNMTSTSLPEQYIFLSNKSMILDTKNRVKIDGKECDIYSEKYNLIQQYDGEYYHKDVCVDNEFNKKFLQSKKNLIIRFREKGCPELEPMERLFIINVSSKYTEKSLQESIKVAFEYVNSKFSTDFSPHFDKKMYSEAKSLSTNAKMYKLLLEEFVSFVDRNKRLPVISKKESKKHLDERHIAERIYYAMKNNLFSTDEKEIIMNLKEKYMVKYYTPKEHLKNSIEFCIINNRLPNQTSSDNWERKLARGLNSSVSHNRFTIEESRIYKDLVKQYGKNQHTAQDNLDEFICFIFSYAKIPSIASINLNEKSIACRISHTLHKGKFTNEQKRLIIELKELLREKKLHTEKLLELEIYYKKNRSILKQNILEKIS